MSHIRIAEAISDYIVDPIRPSLIDLLSAYDSTERANDELLQLTGVRHFFHNRTAFEEFQRALALTAAGPDLHTSREWGDFQTPPELATKVCHYLVEAGISPQIIIETTYGEGNFILAALKSLLTVEFVYGVELQEKYEWHLKTALLIEALKGPRTVAEIELHQDDIFTHRFSNQ